MTNKVYIVTSGSYSDRGNEAAFTSKRKAEDYVKLLKKYGDHYVNEYVEELELDPIVDVSHIKFKNFYYVEMEKDGNILYVNEHNDVDILNKDKKTEWLNFISEAYYPHSLQLNQRRTILRGIINADTRQHAIKILNDKRRQLIE